MTNTPQRSKPTAARVARAKAVEKVIDAGEV